MISFGSTTSWACCRETHLLSSQPVVNRHKRAVAGETLSGTSPYFCPKKPIKEKGVNKAPQTM
eukprot:1567174-Amphidinium_carterae.1